jgi:hypothetical protein
LTHFLSIELMKKLVFSRQILIVKNFCGTLEMEIWKRENGIIMSNIASKNLKGVLQMCTKHLLTV